MASIKNRLSEISDTFGKKKYKSHVNKYQKLCEVFYTTQAQMESLQSVKGSIDADRFKQQAKEYQSVLDHVGPQIAETRQIIENTIIELEKKNEQLQDEIETNQDKINQETLLLESAALSKEKYTEIITPLKKALKRLHRESANIQRNIEYLQNAIWAPNNEGNPASENNVDSEKTDSGKEKDSYHYGPESDKEPLYDTEFSNNFDSKNRNTTPLHNYSSQKNADNHSGAGGFGKDFSTGCLYVFLAIFGLIVLGVLLQVGGLLVYPFIIIACIIIFMAATGRLVNFLKGRW